jgi:hypothetical protein
LFHGHTGSNAFGNKKLVLQYMGDRNGDGKKDEGDFGIWSYKYNKVIGIGDSEGQAEIAKYISDTVSPGPTPHPLYPKSGGYSGYAGNYGGLNPFLGIPNSNPAYLTPQHQTNGYNTGY